MKESMQVRKMNKQITLSANMTEVAVQVTNRLGF